MNDRRSSTQLVVYSPEYAQSIADMWNLSNDSWGGSTSVRTAEQVRDQEASSDSMIVFLAIEEQDVIGYCSICEYRDENGALYVQLLNVRPDYHGQGVGKQLLLQAVEETMKRGWKRLDLHTWPSNLKAVPLYKRCGFFWEERDDQVHLMNFIPQIVTHEALKPYLQGFDWYRDLIREIQIMPDAQVINGFHTYSYKWTNAEQSLQVDIERRGRGICLIETADYRISAHTEVAEPVFGQSYHMQYEIVNKSGAPLQIAFNGVNDQNIQFEWQTQVDVAHEEVVTAPYYVGLLDYEPNEYRTCPTVCADCTINGLQIQLKVGVIPRFPAKITMKTVEQSYALGGKYQFYIDMENQYPVSAAFTFQLPGEPWIMLDRDQLHVQLEAKERVSIPVPFHLLDYGVYTPKLTIEAKPEHGETITFMRPIGGGFGGPGAMAVDEHESGQIAINGSLRMMMAADTNVLRIAALGAAHEGCQLLFPRIGLPFNSEFAKQKPERVELLEQRNGVGFKHTYRSEQYRPLLLHTYTMLYADGTVKLWQELYNDSDEPYEKQVSVSQRIHIPLYRAVLPYEGNMVQMDTSHGNDYDQWDSNLLTERWLFARLHHASIGITWSEQHSMMFGNWFMDYQFAVESIPAHAVETSEPIVMSLGNHMNWQTFRSLALKGKPILPTKLIQDVSFSVNDGNPFLAENVEQVDVTFRDLKKNSNQGTITAANSASQQLYEVTSEQTRTEASLSLDVAHKPIDVVHTQAILGARIVHSTSALFRTEGEITYEQQTVDGYDTLKMSNDTISLTVAAGYYNSLISLQVQGQEWLDSNYPHYSAKSWYNPWIGGLYSHVSSLQAHNLFDEHRSAEAVQMVDNQGNMWSGIRVTQEIKHHKTFKGVRWDSYYLLLPGVPVVAYVTDVHQHMGWYLGVDRSMNTSLFIQSNDSQDHGWLLTSHSDGSPLHYQLGHGDMDIQERKGYVIRRSGVQSQMHIVTDESRTKLNLYSNKDLSCVSFVQPLEVESDTIARMDPIFFVFAEDMLPYESLSSLRELTFPLLSHK